MVLHKRGFLIIQTNQPGRSFPDQGIDQPVSGRGGCSNCATITTL